MVLEGERLAADVDLARLAEQTDGYSGSDLKQLSVQAAMRPVRSFLEADSATVTAAEAAADVAEAAQQDPGEGVAAAEHEQAEGGAVAEPAAAAEGGGAGGPAAGAAVSLPLVPRLNSLLRQAERIASRPTNPKTDLRPICMKVGGRAHARLVHFDWAVQRCGCLPR